MDFSQIKLSKSQFHIIKTLVKSDDHEVVVADDNCRDIDRLERLCLCKVLLFDEEVLRDRGKLPKRFNSPLRAAYCTDKTEDFYYYYLQNLKDNKLGFVKSAIIAVIGAAAGVVIGYIFGIL